MSNFRALAQAMLNPNLDATFGEALTFVPMIAMPNASPAPDPARASATCYGIFSWKSDTAFTRIESKQSKGMSASREDMQSVPVVTRSPTFSFAANCAPAFRRQDQIVRCVDNSLWEITAIRPDGVARIEVRCVQLGLSSRGDF